MHSSEKPCVGFGQSHFILALFWIGIFLCSLPACGPAQDTRAEQVTTDTSTPDLAAGEQRSATNAVDEQQTVGTSIALGALAALPTPPPAPPTPVIPIVKSSSTPVLATPTVSASLQDFPFPPGEKNDFFASTNLVSFSTQSDFNQAVLFYENQLPTRQWNRQASGTFISNNSALIIFTKNNLTVTISIRANPITGLTGIVITLQQ